MATSGICFFCRTSCQSTGCDCSCGSDFVPLFLTYLNTINMDKKYASNFRREDFHSCEKCGTLLQTICGHLQKLGQDLFRMYTITLENLDRDEVIEEDDVLQKLRRKSVSQFNPSVAVIRVHTDLESRRPQESDRSSCSSPIYDDAQSDLDLDDGPFKIELDGEEDESDPEYEVVEQISDSLEWEDLGISPNQEESPHASGESSSDDGDLPLPRKRRRRRKSDPLRVKKPRQRVRKSPRVRKVIAPPEPEETDSEAEKRMVKVLHGGVEIKSDGSIFKCGLCNSKSTTWRAMTCHVKQHAHLLTDRLPFHCSSCGSLFSSQDLLTLHILQSNKCDPATMDLPQPQKVVTCVVTGLDPTFDKKCDECDLSFKSDATLTNHKVEVHLNGARYQCAICFVRFRGQSNYDYHVRKCDGSSKTGEEDAAVVVADADVPRSSYLGVEMKKIVMDEDALRGLVKRKQHKIQFQCGRCKYRCANKGNLKQHIRLNHTDNVPFKCLRCGFTFACQTTLDQHLLDHPTHRNFTCKVCQSVFTLRKTRDNHVLKVHEKPDLFSCPHCGRGFRNISVAERHKTTCGGGVGEESVQKFDEDAKSRLEAEQESIRGREIISNYCKFCRKMVFGSAPTFTLHEKICRNSATDLKWGELLVPVRTGVWLLDNVEIAMTQILENPLLSMYKCGGCNETFLNRSDAKDHAKKSNHGKVREEQG